MDNLPIHLVVDAHDRREELAVVAAVLAGDEQGVRRFIERYQDVVFGLCLRMLRHRQDAEDVMQETFLRALRSLGGFDASRPLRPWILGIAANRCRTALSRRGRRPVLVPTVDERVDERRPAESDGELVAELGRALERLRPEYRLVFVLFHEQGLAYEEIGESLGRPVGTIKTWLHRARAELAGHLGRRGIECHPGTGRTTP